MNESNVWIRFVLAVLATWRVTHLLASEDGPADLIVRLRALLGSGFIGQLMDCFYCLSLWIAAPAALFISREPLGWLFSWLALSGAACLLESRVHRQTESNPVWPTSRGELEYVLRAETPGTSEEPDSINYPRRFVRWPDDGNAASADPHLRGTSKRAV